MPEKYARPELRFVVALGFQDRDADQGESPDDWFEEWQIPSPVEPIDAVLNGSVEEMLEALPALFSPVTPYGTVILPDGTIQHFDEAGPLPPIGAPDD